MILLIDECLHTSLTEVANRAGFEAHHVNWRGWSGLTDRKLLELVVREEFVLVTNNARDFRKLMAEAELHAGRFRQFSGQNPEAHQFAC